MLLGRWLSVLLMLVALPLAAADAEWRLEKDKDGIRIYSRAVEGWTIREIRGITRYQGRLSSLVAVIDDTAAAPELNEFVEKSAIERRDSQTRYQTYAQTRMPWPLDDRDVLMQRQIVQDPGSRAVTITDAALDKVKPVQKDYVRIVRSRQEWKLKPAADGSIEVELRMLTDPAGPIPSSLLNKLSINTPFNTLARLKALAQKPPYANARLGFIREPGTGP